MIKGVKGELEHEEHVYSRKLRKKIYMRVKESERPHKINLVENRSKIKIKIESQAI